GGGAAPSPARRGAGGAGGPPARPGAAGPGRGGPAGRPRRGRSPGGTGLAARAGASAHGTSYKNTSTSSPAAWPSDSAGTSTKPSARVVELRIEAPLTASGSTRPPLTCTRT